MRSDVSESQGCFARRMTLFFGGSSESPRAKSRGCNRFNPCRAHQENLTKSKADSDGPSVILTAPRSESFSVCSALVALLLLASSPAEAHRCASTSAASLSPRAATLWVRIKAAFPDARIVSARRCGARTPSGHRSYHASGDAIDWTTRRFAAGVAWSRKHAPGLTMTYPGMSHIHSDVGRWKAYAHGYGGRRSRTVRRAPAPIFVRWGWL